VGGGTNPGGVMPEHLVLRLDAPLMSFGAPIIDNYGRIERFMSASTLAGLLANALGFDHCQYTETQTLQSRLRFAQRCDKPGRLMTDFQTVALGQEFLKSASAWTTWGRLDERKGGPDAREGTHIRYRDHLADAVYTLAFRLEPIGDSPTLDDCARALEQPARPLFIGRKPCLPATPLLLTRLEAPSPLDVLVSVCRVDTARTGINNDEGLAAWWSPEDGGPEIEPSREIFITDQRDWKNQIHCGERVIRHGLIFPPPHENITAEAKND